MSPPVVPCMFTHHARLRACCCRALMMRGVCVRRVVVPNLINIPTNDDIPTNVLATVLYYIIDK